MLKKIDFHKVKITGGFWREKQNLVSEVSVRAVYDRFKDTGRIEAFKFNWNGEPEKQPHFFWDSDVAKWIEGVAYILRDREDKELETLADEIIDDIEKNQGEDGYFNIFYSVVRPNERFVERDKHELYCAGHLMEAAVAYYEATGKRKLLDCMCKYADYIELRFKTLRDTPFITSGHQEIELALFRLYECTGERRYFELAEYFINERGKCDPPLATGCTLEYNQSHIPVREQRVAVGHAVRATYLYCAMADLARYTGEKELFEACDALFDSIVKRRMYITGGIGSSCSGESFTVDYDLPNLLAYSESCAAIGLVLFANRMLEISPDSKYSDTIERVIYNGFLSSTSLDGKSFFYENPLEVLPYLLSKDTVCERNRIRYPSYARQAVFKTSCCPPNVVRFMPSIANIIFGDDGERVYLHQYMNCETEIERAGKKIKLTVETDFPLSGKVKVTSYGGNLPMAVRIPAWHKGKEYETELGYTYMTLIDGESKIFDFDMTPRFVEAHPDVLFCASKYAVMRGPVVYCSEAVDNGAALRDLRLDLSGKIEVGGPENFGIPTLKVPAYRRKSRDSDELYRDEISPLVKTVAKLIPYYAFANRGDSEMQVWHGGVIR